MALIPRYFDLLVLLVEHRNEAVHRRTIFDSVWSDVVVSDGALSQAVRTLRRALDDDPGDPRYIRTVSRHGYQFVFPDVAAEEESPQRSSSDPQQGAGSIPSSAPEPGADAIEQALETLLAGADGNGENEGDRRREAAELLHGLGAAEAMRRLDRRPGHERARALLRDARWDVPGAQPVPLWGQPGALAATLHLVRLRLARALRLAEARWASAALGGAVAGACGGALGGLALVLGPGSSATAGVPAALAVLGALMGGVAGAGVGGGLAAAEAVFRSFRGPMLVAFGALSGAATGGLAHLAARLTLESLVGRDFSPLGGAFEGFALGGAAAVGYALSTHPQSGGMAAPRGLHRLLVALVTGGACALAGGLVGGSGYHLGAMSLNFLAHSFPASRVGIEPLARLLGEHTVGPFTRVAISAGEGGLFGFGLACGLTRRPR